MRVALAVGVVHGPFGLGAEGHSVAAVVEFVPGEICVFVVVVDVSVFVAPVGVDAIAGCCDCGAVSS